MNNRLKSILFISTTVLFIQACNTNTTSIKPALDACDQGYSTPDCLTLAYQYHSGKGKPKNIEKSILLYEKACDNGRPKGCFLLGRHYQAGEHIPKDYTKAIKLYKEACQSLHTNACAYVGIMYHTGRGVAQGTAIARAYYKKSCEGFSQSNWSEIGCTNLGYMHFNGEFINRDEEKAIELFHKGCDGGDYRGCLEIGDLYTKGSSTIPKDEKKALRFYETACGLNTNSCEKWQDFFKKQATI